MSTTAAILDFTCDGCGYDLRAHAAEGSCPECGLSVAESRRVSAVPRRPAWRDSDPRWRRRVLAGVWLLVLMPLADVVSASRTVLNLPVPAIVRFPGNHCVGDTLLLSGNVYQPILFCTGVVLLFSIERGRRTSKSDWTRRWGILCSYATALLSASWISFVAALVAVGISAAFMDIAIAFQPRCTGWFAVVSTAWLHYGPQPNRLAEFVNVDFASATVLLACVPLTHALRGSGMRRFAPPLLLSPVAIIAVIQVADAGLVYLGVTPGRTTYPFLDGWYFRPDLLVAVIDQHARGVSLSGSSVIFLTEALKWGTVFAIAVRLSAAQIAAWRRPAFSSNGHRKG